jgi:CheY-like chemotaxis protein
VGRPRGQGQAKAREDPLLRILLVDDHEDTNRIMQLLLERLGHQVATAGSVNDALEAARAQRFDVLISDIGLPDGSGLDLMRQVSEIQPIIGIALSGFAMDEDAARSRKAGFDEHLTKPLNFKRLEAILHRYESDQGPLARAS